MDLDEFLEVARKPLYLMLIAQLVACVIAVGLAYDAKMESGSWFQVLDFVLLVVALVVPALVGMSAYRKTRSMKQTIVKGAVFGFFVGLTGLVLALAFQPLISPASPYGCATTYSPIPFPVHVGFIVPDFVLLMKWALAIIVNALLAGIGALGIAYSKRGSGAGGASAGFGARRKRK
ncbi:MAG: hypothetical protein V1817_04790 [Candidatus Micrarchaeota archaeon]